MPGGGWYDSRYPRDVDIVNGAIPASLTAIFSTDGEIFEINVSNPTGGAITLLVQDQQASPQVLVPTVSIGAGVLQLILYQGDGLLCKGGAKWQASGAGLVGSVRGRRTTGWSLDANSTYCNNTSS